MLTFRRINMSDIGSVEEFLISQLSSVPTVFFYPPDIAILQKSLSEDGGFSRAAFYGKRLIGVRLSYLPGLSIENHGYDLGYSESELLSAAQFHGTLVRRDLRYTGIGNLMVSDNCKEIFKQPSIERILATVHTENTRSIKMLLNNGFNQRKITLKYQNLPRIIFEKLK